MARTENEGREPVMAAFTWVMVAGGAVCIATNATGWLTLLFILAAFTSAALWEEVRDRGRTDETH
jgi:hypothetical protein